MTKGLGREKIDKYMKEMNASFPEGRARLAIRVHEDGNNAQDGGVHACIGNGSRKGKCISKNIAS